MRPQFLFYFFLLIETIAVTGRFREIRIKHDQGQVGRPAKTRSKSGTLHLLVRDTKAKWEVNP